MIKVILVFVWLGISVFSVYNLKEQWAQTVFFLNGIVILIPMLLAQRYRSDDY